MTDPHRWADAPTTPGEKLVALTAEVHPREVDVVQGWTRVLVATAKPRRDWRLVPAFFGSVALGALLMTVLRPAAPSTGPRPEVVASTNAKWELKNGEVVVGLGKVTIGAKAAVIATPHLRFQVVNGRVAADVSAERTLLLVEEGEAVMRSGTRLAKGAKLGWPPAPEIAPSLLSPPTAGTVCSDAADAQRAECLELESQGDGLQAQAALYELGQLHAREQRPAEALEAWQRSLARFPSGVLHPEVRLAALLELTRQQRFAEAEAAARTFETECPGDPRIPDVARLRASLRPLP